MDQRYSHNKVWYRVLLYRGIKMLPVSDSRYLRITCCMYSKLSRSDWSVNGPGGVYPGAKKSSTGI